MVGAWSANRYSATISAQVSLFVKRPHILSIHPTFYAFQHQYPAKRNGCALDISAAGCRFDIS
jgi:hypothetical protein